MRSQCKGGLEYLTKILDDLKDWSGTRTESKFRSIKEGLKARMKAPNSKFLC